MNDNRTSKGTLTPFLVTMVSTELKLEPLRQLEIQLDGSTLVFTVQSIGNNDINLGSIESAITRIEFPIDTIGITELVQGLFQHSFSIVPNREFTKVAIRTGRE